MATSNASLANKTKIFTNLSMIAQAMGSPVRMRIIQILCNKPSSVEEISDKLDESIGNTSQHLQKLKKANIVSVQKTGLQRTYSLASPMIIKVFLAIQELTEIVLPENAELERKLVPVDLIAKETPKEVLKLVRAGKALLLDVRDEEEFEYAHPAEAILFPRKFKDADLKKLSKSKKIFIYCRGRYCTLANDLVTELRDRGYKVFRLKSMVHELI